MIRTLTWLAVLGAVLYLATRYAAPQIRAWRFEDAMSQTARLSVDVDEKEMRRALLESAGDLHVPLSSSRLNFVRGREGQILISASWEEIVSMRAWRLGEWVDTLHYSFEVDYDSERRAP